MGESLQGSNRIYCVSRPERPSGARVQRGATKGSKYFLSFSKLPFSSTNKAKEEQQKYNDPMFLPYYFPRHSFAHQILLI